MSLVYQGTPTTATIHKGAIGAMNALIIPFENSVNPAAYISSYPNLRLIRVNSNNNNIEWWDGNIWNNLAQSHIKIQFLVGETEGSPLDGTIYYTNSIFQNNIIDVSSTAIGGDLIEGIHYKRTDGVGGADNTLGNTIELLDGLQFIDGASWTFKINSAPTQPSTLESGSFSFTGDGISLEFSFPHNIGVNPTAVTISTLNGSMNNFTISKNNLTITLKFAISPALDSENSYSWIATY